MFCLCTGVPPVAPITHSKYSVYFSYSIMSDSLQPHGLQHARLPCPTPTPRAYSNSCPLSQWHHPTISSLSSPSLPIFHISQHQGLFQWVSSLHQEAKVWELQHQSSSHVWMWELDCEESWAPKNWCFWTVVLEKTLESPLDKEIQPVHPLDSSSYLYALFGRLCPRAWFQLCPPKQ